MNHVKGVPDASNRKPPIRDAAAKGNWAESICCAVFNLSTFRAFVDAMTNFANCVVRLQITPWQGFAFYRAKPVLEKDLLPNRGFRVDVAATPKAAPCRPRCKHPKKAP
jgi:hypothetical protein